MGCLDEETVLALVEGALAAPARADADRHLARCDACRGLVARAAEALLSTGIVSASEADAGLVRPPRRGDAVGRYRVTGLLGAGAMGVVVAAHDEQLGREVALKLLRRDASRESRERFLREARAAARITHPGVVAVHDVLTTADGHPVLVMDRLQGETLRALLERERRLEVDRAIAIACEIAAALEAAHAQGVIHRDLKPENVFLATREDGQTGAVLLDFGVAKLARPLPAADGAGLTVTGMIVGTPYYMAPEQAFAERDLDARADLWSLGVILYECLSGRRPFAADSVGQVLRLLALGELTPLREVAPELPPRLLALVERLLSRRELRPASAAEVRALLERVHDLPAPARRLRPAVVIALCVIALAAGAWAIGARADARSDLAAEPQRDPVDGASAAARVPEQAPSSPLEPEVAHAVRAQPKRPLAAARPPIAEPSPSAPALDAGKRDPGPGGLLTHPPF